MAKRGTSKRKSVEQEEYIAALYGGRRSRSSGAAETDAGDVRTRTHLLECKVTGEPGVVKRNKLVTDMEKVTEEAWQEGRIPAVALRYWDPDSILADRDGWIDLIVKRAADDAS